MARTFNETALDGKTAVSIAGLMEYLGCSRATLWRMSKRNEIPSFFEVSGSKYFEVETVKEFYRNLNRRQNRQSLKR